MDKKYYEDEYEKFKKIYFDSEMTNSFNNYMKQIGEDNDLSTLDKTLLESMYRDLYNYRMDYTTKDYNFKGLDIYYRYVRASSELDTSFLTTISIERLLISRAFANKFLEDTKPEKIILLFMDYWVDYLTEEIVKLAINNPKNMNNAKLFINAMKQASNDLLTNKLVNSTDLRDIQNEIISESIDKAKKLVAKYKENKIQQEQLNKKGDGPITKDVKYVEYIKPEEKGND